MRHADRWVASKFVFVKGELRASRDPRAVGVASRVVADLTARFYGEQLPRFAKGHLVDLGCGRVPLFEAYKGHVDRITCVDWANTKHSSPHLDLEQDLCAPLRLDDACCQTIILSDVLEHLPHPRHLFVEMHRILAVGGHVILNVPFHKGLHEAPHDYHRFTRYALEAMAQDAGFEVVLLQELGGAPEVLGDILARTLRDFPRGGRDMAKVVQAFTAWFVRNGFGRRLSQRTAREHPLGYGMVLRKMA